MEGMIGEINLFAGTFAPKNWAFCQGQTIAIASNTALFSILGVTYGGNGTTNFQLPNLSGRVAIGAGTGPGLSNYQLGEEGGDESTTIMVNNLPPHNHTIAATAQTHASDAQARATNTPTGAFWGTATTDAYGNDTSVAMAPDAITLTGSLAPTGSGVPFINMQPYLAMNYVICMFGIFPQRP